MTGNNTSGEDLLTAGGSFNERLTQPNILRILKRIYIRNICGDFRRPVGCMYPELASTYKAVIREPMDLGTLILRMYNGLDDIIEVKRCLKLTFSNALLFNHGVYQMEAISNHINLFAKGLWEEAFCIPYGNDPSSQQFISQRLVSRTERFSYVMDESLCLSELQELHDLFVRLHVTDAFEDIQATIIHSLKERLSSNEVSTLLLVLSPVYDEISDGSFDKIFAASSIIVPMPAILVGCSVQNAASLSDNALKFLFQIDESIGELLVCITERKLRGVTASSIWAQPSYLRWGQIRSTSPWEPMIVLAGGDVSDAVTITNLSRIPETFSKQLVKSKPKAPNTVKLSSSVSVYCTKSLSPKVLCPPEGYLLVESLGTHEFTWLKSETTAPLTDDLLPPTKEDDTGSGAVGMEAVTEILEWLQGADSDEYDDGLFIDVATIRQSVTQDVAGMDVSTSEPVVISTSTASTATTKAKSKRKYTRPDKNHKVPAYPPNSLYLSNNVIIPAFIPLALGASKRDAAKHKTRLLVSWIGFNKPLGSCPGLSPFDEDQGGESLAVVLEPISQALPMSKPAAKKMKKEEKVKKEEGSIDADAAGVSSRTPRFRRKHPAERHKSALEELGRVEPRLEQHARTEDDDASTVSLHEDHYQKELAAQPKSQGQIPPPPPPTLFSSHSCISASGGEGLIHTKFIDPHSSIFFREHRSRDMRKLLLREELGRVRTALSTLQSEAFIRQGDKKRAIYSASSILKVSLHPGRSGGVGVGNAKVGLARALLEAADLPRGYSFENVAGEGKAMEMAL